MTSARSFPAGASAATATPTARPTAAQASAAAAASDAGARAQARRPADPPLPQIAQIPAWAGALHGDSPEQAAFRAGSALATLHQLVHDDALPWRLMRDRLALRAAETCLIRAGRPERAAALRDEIHMLRPGDLPGPGGAVYLAWRQAVARPVSSQTLQRALPAEPPEQIRQWLKAGRGGPAEAAAPVLAAVLAAAPAGGETTALILADAALARALKWPYLLPLISLGVSSRDLRGGAQGLTLACLRALPGPAHEVIVLANALARGAARLRAVQPKLRAKQADAAVEMFLGQDAVMPSALPMPDRAARRLCERLVDLGALRELTGRDSFRLYGI